MVSRSEAVKVRRTKHALPLYSNTVWQHFYSPAVEIRGGTSVVKSTVQLAVHLAFSG